MLGRVAHWVSVALVLHAGFSTIHFKSLVKDAELVPPIDVVIEVCVRPSLPPSRDPPPRAVRPSPPLG